jgi:anti-sigma regulatory factor (Ser/Thr protein kinase)/anti-anti-sigma regulatory factor
VPGTAHEDERPGRLAAGDGRLIVAELQEALLPTALPVLPQARIAARYLVAGHEQAAGGDWFDAIPLADGSVALIVGDVVGHGVAASAAMGQLRAVLAELLAAEKDLSHALERADAFAARTPALRAATLALVVLDPADGSLRYATCGHPPPLVIGTGGTTRYLEGTRTGPLGTRSAPVLATDRLASGELVLLYSDGLIERPDQTMAEGMAELAAVAADAAGKPGAQGAHEVDPAAAERVCQLTVERLTRTGHADDITALAAQWLADPVPALHLELPSRRPSLAKARDAFAGWLSRLDAAAEDWEALHLAMVEVFTNAIEHAYPREAPGSVELDAELGDDGYVECRVTDQGTWRPPDPADADRGHGLMVAGQVVDRLLVSHPPQAEAATAPEDAAPETGTEAAAETGTEAAAETGAVAGIRAAARTAVGTTVALRHRLRRPAILASGHRREHAADPAEPPFTVDTSIAAGSTARALVSGRVDITTADKLARRLLSVSRGGTVPLVADLSGVTQLASAGVRALYAVSEQLAAHGHGLTLITAPGSGAGVVLDLVQLAHVTAEKAEKEA